MWHRLQYSSFFLKKFANKTWNLNLNETLYDLNILYLFLYVVLDQIGIYVFEFIKLTKSSVSIQDMII